MVDVFEGPEPRKSRRPKWWLTAGKGVAAGVVLVLALLWLSAGSAISLFPAKSQRVYVVFKSVGGLKKGEKVQVAGLPKGKVTDLGITDVVVEAEGRVKLDEETIRELLRRAQLEDAGEPIEIQQMELSTQPREEAKKEDWVWSISVLVQKGGQPTPYATNGTIRLNNDADVPPDLRQRLVASFEDMEFKRAVNIAVANASGDFDTVFNGFSRDKAEQKLDEVGDEKTLFAFSVRVRMPQQMVLCTLELDEDVPIGGGEKDVAKRPPYLITVQQTTPLIGTPFVAMERTPLGKPLVMPLADDERRDVRKRPLNLGKQEATDFGQLADSIEKFVPKFEETFQYLGKAVEDLSRIAAKVNEGDGAIAMLVNDRQFREDFRAAVADIRSVVGKIDRSEGTLGKMASDPKLYDELADASKRLNEVLAKVQTGGGTAQLLLEDKRLYEEAVAASTEARQVLEKLNNGDGALPRLLNDPKLGEDVVSGFHDLSSVAKQMQSGEGPFSAFLNDQALKQDIQIFAADLREIVGEAKPSLKPVWSGLSTGSTTLGKLAVDPKLGKKVEEAIGGAAETFGGIARTRTFLGVTSKYWGTTEQWVTKGYLRVAPRENMFVQLGGCVISTSQDSPIDSDADDEGETIFKPDVQLGYKFFDNHLTLRVGLLEGEPGGGVDYTFTVPGWNHDVTLTGEARGGHDEDDDGIDEGEDVIVRGEISTQIWKYIRVYAGAGNSVDGMDFMGGITFEWNDDDLKSFIGLLGSAK